MSDTIGWIGIGNLGGAIVEVLLAAGIDVTVFDVNAERMAALQAHGARKASSPADMAVGVNQIFATIPNDKILAELVGGEAGLARTATSETMFVDLSTVSPQASAKVAAILAPTGASYLRAAVSGSTASVAKGLLTIYASGPRVAFERSLPILRRVSRRQDYVGQAEEARIFKLVINTIVGAIPVLLSEALSLGTRNGLDWSALVDAISSSVVASPLLGYKAEAIKAKDWTPTAQLALGIKDLSLALEAGGENAMPITRLVRDRYIDATEQFYGDLDFFALVTGIGRK